MKSMFVFLGLVSFLTTLNCCRDVEHVSHSDSGTDAQSGSHIENGIDTKNVTDTDDGSDVGNATDTKNSSDIVNVAGTENSSDVEDATDAENSSDVDTTTNAENGSDNENGRKETALISFLGSPCKHYDEYAKYIQPGMARAALAGTDLYQGLQCIVWRTISSEQIEIDLINFKGACGAEWSGDASIDETGGVKLNVNNPECQIAFCGSCIYDWFFDIKDVTTVDDLKITITIDTCPGEYDVITYERTLPVKNTPEGEVCRYADSATLGQIVLSNEEKCGGLFMPCYEDSPACGPPEARINCQGDLICAPTDQYDVRVCHQKCKTTEECPLPGTLSCQEGLCRPANNW